MQACHRGEVCEGLGGIFAVSSDDRRIQRLDKFHGIGQRCVIMVIMNTAHTCLEGVDECNIGVVLGGRVECKGRKSAVVYVLPFGGEGNDV